MHPLLPQWPLVMPTDIHDVMILQRFYVDSPVQKNSLSVSLSCPNRVLTIEMPIARKTNRTRISVILHPNVDHRVHSFGYNVLRVQKIGCCTIHTRMHPFPVSFGNFSTCCLRYQHIRVCTWVFSIPPPLALFNLYSASR